MRRLPISLVRAGIQMARTISKKHTAEKLFCSKSVVSKWRRKFRDSGHLFSEVDKLSDEELNSILYKKSHARRFFPWQSDEDLCQEFTHSNLSVKAFYKTIYLPKVPEGVKPMAYGSFHSHIHPNPKRGKIETLQSLDAVQCFDLSNKVSVNDCIPSDINQVRITLASGTSIAFYPGSASEAFVAKLLRQNGVKI